MKSLGHLMEMEMSICMTSSDFSRLVHVLAHLGYREYTWVLKYIKGICFRCFGGYVISYRWYWPYTDSGHSSWVLLIFRLTPAMYQVLVYFTSVWACDSLTNGCSSFSSPYSALGHPGETILCTCYLWFSLNIMLLVGSGLSCKERTGQKWIDFFF